MIARFTSESQANLFGALRSHLRVLGYRGQLLAEDYAFSDLFRSSPTERTVALAAFGQSPPTYENACFGVLAPNHSSGADLIYEHRSLGAPLAFEVRQDRIVHWRVGTTPQKTKRLFDFGLEEIDRIFGEHGDEWKPRKLLRAKNIPAVAKSVQSYLFDDELVPEIEGQIKRRLQPILENACATAQSLYRQARHHHPDHHQLFRLAFWLLAGKVFRDRGNEKFADLGKESDSDVVLQRVATYYGEPFKRFLIKPVRDLLHSKIWGGIDFRNLSFDVLTWLWSNTFVSEADRKAFGIHSTPRSVAKYIVETLPIERLDPNDRIVLEPCCGSGVFLLAAMQRLRDLLPLRLSEDTRHRYLKRRLHGLDQESFGVEITKLSLMLADYPNPNGWKVKRADVFSSHTFTEKVRRARIVLCNPPFESMADTDKAAYGAQYKHKPAELLRRIVENAHKDAMLGFVVPHSVIDGSILSPLRQQLTDRFANIEVVSLPHEAIFSTARHPSALLLAHGRRTRGNSTVALTHSEVAQEGWDEFQSSFAVDCPRVRRMGSTEAASSGFRPPLLESLWESLSSCDTLTQAASDIARGVEWKRFDKDIQISNTPLPGFIGGFHTSIDMCCFEPPPYVFLDARPDNRKYKAWDRPWHLPKVICNSIRKSSTGPWQMTACAMDLKVYCTQNFTTIWPRAPWTPRTLAAVINGPVACAYMASHASWKHMTKLNLGRLPLPKLSQDQRVAIEALVVRYEQLASIKRDAVMSDTREIDAGLVDVLKMIDGLVLHAYKLPMELLDEMLYLFDGKVRPALVQYDLRDLLESVSDPADIPIPEDTCAWGLIRRAIQQERV